MNITPEHRWELSKFERMVKDNRVRKMTPHIVFPDGSKEPIFFNDQGWFQAGLEEVCSLSQFYDEELHDGLLDGVKVALRKNDNYRDDMLMAWANSLR